MLRQQLPVYSPLSATALAGAAWDALRGHDAVEGLRTALLRRLAADAAVLCGSGTQALQLAIELARSRAGADASVALPAFACFSVASAAVGARAPVLLYDIDPETLAPDLESLEAACAAGARVIVVVHCFGIPVDWDAVSACAARYGALLIEDAAQGHGGGWRGRPLGTLGPLSVLSFGRGKGWTGGAGGALLLRAEAAAWATPTPVAPPLLGAARLILTTAAQWLLGRPAWYGLPASLPWLGLGETRYEPPRPVARVPQPSAALLLRLQEVADRQAEARRAAGEVWAGAVRGQAGVSPVNVRPGAQPGYLRFPLRLAGGLAGLRDRRAALRLGIAPSYPHSLGRLPALLPLLVGGAETCLRADELCQELVTLPTHSRVQASERAAIVALLADGREREPRVHSPSRRRRSPTVRTN